MMQKTLEQEIAARKELEKEVHSENLVGIDFLALLAGIAVLAPFVLK